LGSIKRLPPPLATSGVASGGGAGGMPPPGENQRKILYIEGLKLLNSQKFPALRAVMYSLDSYIYLLYYVRLHSLQGT